MASQDSLKIRSLLSAGVTVQTGTDTPIAFRLAYVGRGSVTSVTTITATNIITISVEPSGTVTKTYAFATYTTIGAVVDAINADGYFTAKVLDVLRSTASASTMLAGAITAGKDVTGTVIWDQYMDTSASLQIASCLSPFRDNVNAPKGHRVILQEFRYAVNMGTAAADSAQIFIRNGTTEYKVFGALSVDTTDTTITFAAGLGKITAPENADIIVLVKDAATLADAAGNYVRATGVLE